MAKWIRDEGDYKVRAPGAREDSVLHVTGLMDSSGGERPKMLVENSVKNQGPSVEGNAVVRELGIKLLSAAMKIAPEDADWFTRGLDGELQSVSIGYDRVWKENPKIEDLANEDDGIKAPERKALRKIYPDVASNVLRTSTEATTPEQDKELTGAYINSFNAYQDRILSQDLQSEQTAPGDTFKTSAHEYDLSKQSFKPDPVKPHAQSVHSNETARSAEASRSFQEAAQSAGAVHSNDAVQPEMG